MNYYINTATVSRNLRIRTASSANMYKNIVRIIKPIRYSAYIMVF